MHSVGLAKLRPLIANHPGSQAGRANSRRSVRPVGCQRDCLVGHRTAILSRHRSRQCDSAGTRSWGPRRSSRTALAVAPAAAADHSDRAGARLGW